MNALAWVQGLEGLGLAAVICALLFVEEIGVPLPFAPGDLLLALAGVAIAAGRVQPVLMVLLAMGAIVCGALLGREIFALLGWRRLMRVAGPLRMRAPLERAASMLHSNGWRAVFTARLIPGLRVHTTQMAGVSGMPRLVFLGGLLPASAVYVGAFMGLGVAFGRPILHVIHQAERQALLLVLVLVAGAIVVLWLRGRARRVLGSVGGWGDVFKLRLDSPGVALIPILIGLNFTGHAIAVGLRLPLFLDSIGTILGAMLAGPLVGASVGLVTNLVSSNTVDPIAAPYSAVSLAIGFVAGLARRVDRDPGLVDWLALWPVCFLVASLASTPLNVALNGGQSGVPLGDALYARLLAAHLPPFLAAYLGEAAIDLPDKLITVLAAFLIYRSLPRPARQPGAVELDIGAAFASVFRSRRWFRKLLPGALCLLTCWLLVPLLLFMGYAVAVARGAREGAQELPDWGRLAEKLADGVSITALFLIWNLPGLLLGLPANLAGDGATSGAAPRGALDVLAALGGLWGVLALLAQPAIWSQYLQGGFAGGLQVGAIFRRVLFNPGLTIVVAALGIVLPVLALGGLLGLAVGVLFTLPYASWVGARLFGSYCRMTDGAVAGVRAPAPGVG